MPKKLVTGPDALLKMKSGIDQVADIVKATLGPKGRNIVLRTRPYNPLITNDGATIAREIVLEDDIEDAGAALIRSTTSSANDAAGDGSTTTAVLFQALVSAGLAQLLAGKDPVALKEEIEAATAKVVDHLKSESVKEESIESLINIATISCRDSELGKLIAETVHKVGTDGIVTFEDNPKPETTATVSEGLRLHGGFLSPLFITHRVLQEAVYTDVPVFVTDQSLSLGEEVIRIMQSAVNSGSKTAVVIANDISGGALTTIIQNYIEDKFSVLPIRCVAFGNTGEGYLRDVCSITGATFITPKDGRKVLDFTPKEFGRADKVVATKDSTTIMATKGDKDARISELKAQLPNVSDFEAEGLKERIAKLNSALGTISVGSISADENEQKKRRVEDAINATRAAMSDGIVAGGGSALFRAAESTDSKIVSQACQSPLKQIAQNASIVLDRGDMQQVLSDKTKTIDFNNGLVVDAYESGVIDPLKVVVTAIEHAASTAVLFLTSEGIVYEASDSSEKV